MTEGNDTAPSRSVSILRPWWRAAWFIGAVVWAIIFTALDVAGGGVDESLGMISVLPIVAFAVDAVIRSIRKMSSLGAR